MSVADQSIPRAFVGGAALVVGCFILVTTWKAVQSRGADARLRELMPLVGAELVDRELPPEMAGYTLEAPPGAGGGTPVRLEDYPSNTLIFLNFWATWCEPCVREIPSMIQLRREMGGASFAMLAVSYDDSWAEVESFFQRFTGGLPPELHLTRDPAESVSGSLRMAFGTEKLPETWVIRDGRILARFVNARDWTDERMVEFFRRLAGAEPTL